MPLGSRDTALRPLGYFSALEPMRPEWRHDILVRIPVQSTFAVRVDVHSEAVAVQTRWPISFVASTRISCLQTAGAKERLTLLRTSTTHVTFMASRTFTRIYI